MSTLANTLQTLSLDFGNFELKSFDGRQVNRIRSIQLPLAGGQKALKATDKSPVVELDGQRWHVGTQAARYPQQSQATVQGDKVKLAQLHLAACIAHSGSYRLIVSHHSTDDYGSFLRSTLLGEHSYHRNGQPLLVSVSSVQIIDEGRGAYELAKQQGYVPQRGYTVVIDLGGSTWTSSVYAADGELIDHSPHERQGTFALAGAIAKDERLHKPLLEQFSITSPDPVVIQDGFKAGHYYQESNICWADWLAEYLDPWWAGIVATLKSQYQQHLPKVKRFLITGGGAHLISHKVAASPIFLVCPDAPTANVRGGFYLSQSSLVTA
ncbi:MAG: hypothetical protein AAGF01_12535 [Cyanobacteria bacterium P01_G01_bin.38]